MRIFLTGGSGFVGSNLLRSLLKERHEVIATGLNTEVLAPPGITMLHPDMVAVGEEYLEDIDVCFHMAANNDTTDLNSDGMFESNLTKPARLFERLERRGCKKFVYASSTAIYGNQPAPFSEKKTEPSPLNPYAFSKLAFEKWSTEFGIKTKSTVIGLRYSNIYGPGEFHKGKRSSMILQLYKQINEGMRPRIFEDGDQKRDWCYIIDVINANMKCLTCETSGILNIASGTSIDFNSIVRILNNHTDNDLMPDYFTCPFPSRFQTDTRCEIDDAKELLGWEPTYSIEQGICDYVTILKSHYNA
jgi:ADP-L-glycero-D-manno-heptose 6-epimerase